MATRKVWTEKEDETLKHLIEEEGLTKWAEIAHVMSSKYHCQCNEKQCRARYLNKLAKNVSSAPLTPEEEHLMFDLQDQFGNKWALIASKLSRSDNYIKNYFYAKLRRCLRKVNKLIGKFISTEFHKVETVVLYKVIESLEQSELCKKIRDALRNYEDLHFDSKEIDEKIGYAREVAEDFAGFDPAVRRQAERGRQSERVEESRSPIECESESVHSSNHSSHHFTINSYNTTSGRSNSHSNSNNSERSFKNIQPFVSNSNNSLLVKPLQMRRSHSISDDEDPNDECLSLYRSANLDNRSRQRESKPTELASQNYLTSSVNMLEEIEKIEVIKINFISPRVSSESSSRKSDRIVIEIDEDDPNDAPTPNAAENEENLWKIMQIMDIGLSASNQDHQ